MKSWPSNWSIRMEKSLAGVSQEVAKMCSQVRLKEYVAVSSNVVMSEVVLMVLRTTHWVTGCGGTACVTGRTG